MEFEQRLKLNEKPLPIVIVGAGGIVKDAHLPAYTLAGFRVLGIFDVDHKKAKEVQRQFPSVEKVYTSLEALITDAVANHGIFDIAVPVNHLYDILERLPNGAAVLMQKPMGENLREAQDILKLCRSKKLISGVNFQLRFAPYNIAARDIISKGLIGRIYDIELMVCVQTPWKLWDFLFDAPRMEILYHSIHYLDLVRSFLGNPKKIYASTIKHPKMPELASTRSTMILDYDDFTQARIITNHGHEFGLKHQQSYMKLEGTQGAIMIRIGVSLDYPKGMPPKMEYLQLDGKKEWKKIPLSGGWFPNAFMGAMTALQNHVANRTEPLPNSTEDAFDTMRLVEKAYESNEKGGIDF